MIVNKISIQFTDWTDEREEEEEERGDFDARKRKRERVNSLVLGPAGWFQSAWNFEAAITTPLSLSLSLCADYALSSL